MKALALFLLIPLIPLQSCQKCEETHFDYDEQQVLGDANTGQTAVANFLFTQHVTRYNDIDCGLSTGTVNLRIVNLTDSTITFPYRIYYNSIIAEWTYSEQVIELAPHDTTAPVEVARTTAPVDDGTLEVSATGAFVYE